MGSFPPPPVRGVAGAQQRPADELVVARVSVRSQQEVERLVRLGLDLLETREGDDLFILTMTTGVSRLRGQGWSVSVDERKTALLRSQHPDLRQSRVKSARTGTAEAGTAQLSADSYGGGYLTVPEMRTFLDAKAQQYPNLAQVFVYGESWERVTGGAASGHELFGIELTNKLREGQKPTFFLMAAIHARDACAPTPPPAIPSTPTSPTGERSSGPVRAMRFNFAAASTPPNAVSAF